MVRYYNLDEIVDASRQGFMEDFLNTFTPNKLPPHDYYLRRIVSSCYLEI